MVSTSRTVAGEPLDFSLHVDVSYVNFRTRVLSFGWTMCLYNFLFWSLVVLHVLWVAQGRWRVSDELYTPHECFLFHDID